MAELINTHYDGHPFSVSPRVVWGTWIRYQVDKKGLMKYNANWHCTYVTKRIKIDKDALACYTWDSRANAIVH